VKKHLELQEYHTLQEGNTVTKGVYKTATTIFNHLKINAL